MTHEEEPTVVEQETTVICWVSETKAFVFDVATAYTEPTLVYSHAVSDGERVVDRPPRNVVRTLRNQYGYTLR